MKNLIMNNNLEIPALGFGTYQITDEEEATRSVINAINVGYRHIDTAQAYLNEEAVGKGIIDSGIKREELFLTTKVWVENVNYQRTKDSVEKSLEKLKVDYLDLLLIHQPYNDIYSAWRAMQEMQKSGLIKSIGVSNFSVDRVVDLATFNEIKPQINQIEVNPFYQQNENLKLFKNENVLVEAWAPFAEGRNNIFSNPILEKIAKKHEKSIAQIILKWLIDKDIVVLVKSSNIDRIKENFDIFSIDLDYEDIDAILKLDIKESQFFSHTDPETVKRMASRRL